jgi:hypothetical protein
MTDAREVNGLTFDQWYALANGICANISGLTLDDLADGPSWDAWNDEVDARTYVQDILTSEGFPTP